MKSKYKSGRSVFALIVVCLVIFSFAADLFNIQVKNNEYYAAQNNTESKYVVELEAARGEIVDRNGNALVTNKQGNSIILNAVFFPSQKDNKRRKHNIQYSNRIPTGDGKNNFAKRYNKKHKQWNC